MDVERGLKCEIKRQVGLKNFQGDKADHTLQYLIRAWKALDKNGVSICSQIWDFIETSPNTHYKRVNTELFGMFSRLDTYENKKGHKSLAHYTHNGKYLGSVKKLGAIPIAYDGIFPITKSQFAIDPAKIQNMKEIADVFVAVNSPKQKKRQEEYDALQMHLVFQLKEKKITHKEGMKILQEQYPEFAAVDD